MNEPEPGICLKAKVVRVKDADTFVVKVERQFPVRVNNLKEPETSTNNGIVRAQLAMQKLPVGKEVTLFIPTHDNDILMDFNSFERIVADVWVDGESYKKFMESH